VEFPGKFKKLAAVCLNLLQRFHPDFSEAINSA